MNADWPSNIDFLPYMVIDNSLADSIPEAAQLFGEAFFLVSTPEAAGLSFKPDTTELFEKFCFSNPAPEAAELSSEKPCLQIQSINVETQDPPAEAPLLTKEASHGPSNNGVPTRYLVEARHSDLSVPGATATDTKSQKITV
jgi:hypothetical protein